MFYIIAVDNRFRVPSSSIFLSIIYCIGHSDSEPTTEIKTCLIGNLLFALPVALHTTLSPLIGVPIRDRTGSDLHYYRFYFDPNRSDIIT